MTHRAAWAAGLVAVGLAATVLLTARPPEAGAGWRALCVAALVGGCGLHAYVCFVRRHAFRRSTLWIWALALRAIVFPLEPSLSDDGYRYLWDGMVQVEDGLSPYALRPSEGPRHSELSETLLGEMNSPDYYSVYPPASQVVFAFAAWAGGDDWRTQWFVLKGALLLAEALGLWALVRVVGPSAAALYALHPLAIVEVAGQGHSEGLVVGALGLVLLSVTTRPVLAGIGVAVGGLVKVYPYAWLLVLARTRRGRLVGACLVTTVALVAPYAAAEAIGHVRESLALFAGTLDFYSAPYLALKAMLYGITGDDSGRVAGQILALLGGSMVVSSALVQDGRVESARRGLAWTTIALVLSVPTLHPWYLLPVLLVTPLLQFQTSSLWLASGAALSYLSYTTGGAGPIALAVGWGGAAICLIRALRSPGRLRD